MPAYLGHVQRAMLARLATGDQTTATLADLASSSVIGDSLRRLAGKGLARVSETIPAARHRYHGGRRRDVWSITSEGRDAYAAGRVKSS